jgi:hypothetical protein
MIREFGSQQVVAVEVRLQAEWAPSGDPKEAQSQLLINEVEVVVETLGAIRS